MRACYSGRGKSMHAFRDDKRPLHSIKFSFYWLSKEVKKKNRTSSSRICKHQQGCLTLHNLFFPPLRLSEMVRSCCITSLANRRSGFKYGNAVVQTGDFNIELKDKGFCTFEVKHVCKVL